MKISDQWAQHIKDIYKGVEPASSDDTYFSSTVLLDDYCRKKPFLALEIVLEIFNSNISNDDVLDNLAAGPLEDLLAYNGGVVVDSVVQFAKDNKVFKEMLSAVWRNNISDAVWEKIKNEIKDLD